MCGRGQVVQAEKKMGFLTTASGEEIFVHARALSASCHGTLREGQAVEFEIAVVVRRYWSLATTCGPCLFALSCAATL